MLKKREKTSKYKIIIFITCIFFCLGLYVYLSHDYVIDYLDNNVNETAPSNDPSLMRFDFSEDSSVFVVKTDEKDNLSVERKRSGVARDWRYKKSLDARFYDGPVAYYVDLDETLLYDKSGRQLSSEETVKKLIELSEKPGSLSIHADVNLVKEDDAVYSVMEPCDYKVFSLSGDLSGKIITSTPHGNRPMTIPCAWTNIESLLAERLLDWKSILIAVAAMILLLIVDMLILRANQYIIVVILNAITLLIVWTVALLP